jgi:Ca-activated chloride channel homolog
MIEKFNCRIVDLKMNKTTKFLFAGIVAAVFGFALFSFPLAQSSAQTSKPAAAQTPAAKPTATPTPSEEDEVIKIGVDLVNLNVRIVDRGNRPISNVTKSEVKVYEDNVLQQIDSFSKAEVPTNYALVIDNSGSLRSQLDKVIEASKVIVNTNRPDDETSVIRFVSSDKIEITQDFSSNKSDVNEALDNLFVEGGQTAIIDAIYLAAEKVDSYEKSRNPNEKKRRALILVSDGEDRDSYYNEQQLFNLLRESDVQIYAVGFTSALEKEGGLISKSPKSKAESFLKRLAEETGGKAYFPQTTAELDQIARDIAAELRTQYVISYYPTNSEKDGRFRNIRVVVDDGPNKQKRIAITRTGRSAGAETTGTKPTLQTTSTRPNN